MDDEQGRATPAWEYCFLDQQTGDLHHLTAMGDTVEQGPSGDDPADRRDHVAGMVSDLGRLQWEAFAIEAYEAQSPRLWFKRPLH